MSHPEFPGWLIFVILLLARGSTSCQQSVGFHPIIIRLIIQIHTPVSFQLPEIRIFQVFDKVNRLAG